MQLKIIQRLLAACSIIIIVRIIGGEIWQCNFPSTPFPFMYINVDVLISFQIVSHQLLCSTKRRGCWRAPAAYRQGGLVLNFKLSFRFVSFENAVIQANKGHLHCYISPPIIRTIVILPLLVASRATKEFLQPYIRLYSAVQLQPCHFSATSNYAGILTQML